LSKEETLNLYPEEVDPLSRALLRLHGANKISDQLDMAEIVGIPWMKPGRANSLVRRKQRQRAKILTGKEETRPISKGR